MINGMIAHQKETGLLVMRNPAVKDRKYRFDDRSMFCAVGTRALRPDSVPASWVTRHHRQINAIRPNNDRFLYRLIAAGIGRRQHGRIGPKRGSQRKGMLDYGGGCNQTSAVAKVPHVSDGCRACCNRRGERHGLTNSRRRGCKEEAGASHWHTRRAERRRDGLVGTDGNGVRVGTAREIAAQPVNVQPVSAVAVRVTTSP